METSLIYRGNFILTRNRAYEKAEILYRCYVAANYGAGEILFFRKGYEHERSRAFLSIVPAQAVANKKGITYQTMEECCELMDFPGYTRTKPKP